MKQRNKEKTIFCPVYSSHEPITGQGVACLQPFCQLSVMELEIYSVIYVYAMLYLFCHSIPISTVI